MAANNKYSIIGRYAQGREIVAFELTNLGTNEHQRYTANQVAYLVGRGSVLNCQGQIYDGKVLFRGVGCSLDQLPTVMEKPAEELNGAEAPIKNTENISGPARRNATNDQLMGQMTLVARVKVEETSKKTLGYDFKNVGGTTGTLWRGEVLKAAREGKITNARVNSANGKEILRSRGTSPEEQLSNLPIRIATPEELKKLGVKVETPATQASAKNSKANDTEKVAEIFKSIISEVMYDSDTRGLAYRPVDVNREPIPMDKIESTEFYIKVFSEISMETVLIIQYQSKKRGYLAELSFDFNKNDTYNNKTSFAVTVAMLVRRTKGERPKNAGRFTFTLNTKTDTVEVYTKIMKNIVNGMEEAGSNSELKLVLLSKAILENLKVEAEAELPGTNVHAESTEGENYAESTLKGYTKNLQSGLEKVIKLKYVINNTTMDSMTFNGKVNVLYAKDDTFWLTLEDTSQNVVQQTISHEIFGADEEAINKIAKQAVKELKLSKLLKERFMLAVVRDAFEEAVNKRLSVTDGMTAYKIFTPGNNSSTHLSDKSLEIGISALESNPKMQFMRFAYKIATSANAEHIGSVSFDIGRYKDMPDTKIVLCTLFDKDEKELEESDSDEITYNVEEVTQAVTGLVNSFDFSQLLHKEANNDTEINWEQIEQSLIATKETTENYLNSLPKYLFTVDGKDRYSNDVIKQYINAIKSGEKYMNLEYKFMNDISGEGRVIGYAFLHVVKKESSDEFTVSVILKDADKKFFQSSEENTLEPYPNLCAEIMEEELGKLNFRGLFDKSISKILGKLNSLYDLAVDTVDEKVENLGLVVLKHDDAEDKEEYLKEVADNMISNPGELLGFHINLSDKSNGEDKGSIFIAFDTSDEHISKLDSAIAIGIDTNNNQLTQTETIVHESSVRLISKLFNAFDFSVFAPEEAKKGNVEAFGSLVALGVNAIYGLNIPGLVDGSPVIKYSDTNGVKVLTEGNGLEKGNFPGGFDLTEDIINEACEAATNGADTVKVSVTTRFYNLDFIVKNNSTFRIVYVDNSNRKSKLIATKEQAIMLDDVDAFEPVMAAAYQSALPVLMELQLLMQAAVESGEDFE